MKTHFYIYGLAFCLLLYANGMQAQGSTVSIEADIEVRSKKDLFELTAVATNKTPRKQYVRYGLSIVKNGSKTGNRSTNKQGGQVQILGLQETTLSTTTISARQQDVLTVLLEIFDMSGRLIIEKKIRLK